LLRCFQISFDEFYEKSVLTWPSGIAKPLKTDVMWLVDFRKAILFGLGSKTPSRQVSAEKLRKSVCTRMDPRFHLLNWKRGDAICPQPSRDVLDQAQAGIIKLALSIWNGMKYS
jgi:hypothetical protein